MSGGRREQSNAAVADHDDDEGQRAETERACDATARGYAARWNAGLGCAGRLRHPPCQLAGRLSQRWLAPVSSISAASANDDLPEPLCPTTSVSPGPGCSGNVRRSPMLGSRSAVTSRKAGPLLREVQRLINDGQIRVVDGAHCSDSLRTPPW